MNILYNKKLYYKYFKVWIFSVVICFIASGLILIFNKLSNIEISFTVITGIFLLPLLITAIYGLFNNYTMTYNVGYIRTGITAIYINISLMLLYIISLITITGG